MFTGIIEEVGTIKQIQKNPASADSYDCGRHGA